LGLADQMVGLLLGLVFNLALMEMYLVPLQIKKEKPVIHTHLAQVKIPSVFMLAMEEVRL
jgi:hypothetical protein